MPSRKFLRSDAVLGEHEGRSAAAASNLLVNEIKHVRAGACRWHAGCIQPV